MTNDPKNAEKLESAWWEKTVEYAFVRDVMPSAQEAFPLAGNAEKAYGDLVTKDYADFRLIEFKARSGDIWKEKRKYASFKTASDDVDPAFHSLLAHCEEEIVGHAGAAAHWLIYGVPTPDRFRFALEGQRYASDGSSLVTLAHSAHLQQLPTVSYEVLSDYLEVLEEARGSSTGKGLGSNGLMIVGVRGGRSLALSVQEFKHPHARPRADEESEFDATLQTPTPVPRRRSTP